MLERKALGTPRACELQQQHQQQQQQTNTNTNTNFIIMWEKEKETNPSGWQVTTRVLVPESEESSLPCFFDKELPQKAIETPKVSILTTNDLGMCKEASGLPNSQRRLQVPFNTISCDTGNTTDSEGQMFAQFVPLAAMKDQQHIKHKFSTHSMEPNGGSSAQVNEDK